MAKWKSPKVHVPYWFDFVGDAKGTGKSSLFGHLFGERAMILPLPSRQEDLFVSAYTNGALVVCDDECTWIGKAINKFSYDQFKSVVTMQKDTFSRKHAQPETHDRPFVIVRTSNEPRTVFSTNERRQIIFNVGLGERECRHWSLPEEDRIQLLAEAKDYVEKHDGQPYRLTKEEEETVELTNLDNFDTESEGYESILRFLRDVQSRPTETIVYQMPNTDNKIYVRYINYVDWSKDNHMKYVDDSRVYNRQMLALARIYPNLLKYDAKKIRFGNTVTRAARIIIEKKEDIDDIPDMF
jgi:predicted P-loop ATPase